MAIRRREPTIHKLVEKYNKLCGSISNLIQQHRAPPGALAPCPVTYEGIFALDIDDNIWQDAGLDDEALDAPAWLADESTCKGINLLLQHDWCIEEEVHLHQELCMLFEWLLCKEDAIYKVHEQHGKFHFIHLVFSVVYVNDYSS